MEEQEDDTNLLEFALEGQPNVDTIASAVQDIRERYPRISAPLRRLQDRRVNHDYNANGATARAFMKVLEVTNPPLRPFMVPVKLSERCFD